MTKVPIFCVQISPGVRGVVCLPNFMGLALLFYSSYVHFTVVDSD